MLISMLAWVLRFGLFIMVILRWIMVMSCVVYGMAFDFFNISGSLFIETTTDFRIRSSAQVVYDDVKRISFFGGIFRIVIDNFYSR
jgi:NHS family xanthosine MFS transporter